MHILILKEFTPKRTLAYTFYSALICELFFKDVLYPQALTLNPMRLPSPNSNKPSGEGNRMALGEKIT